MSQSRPSGSVVVVLVGIYLIVIALVLICFGAGIVGCAGVLGDLTNIAGQMGARGADMAVGAAATGLTAILGILFLAAGIASLAIAIGLFMTKPWAYMGSIVVNGAVIILEGLGILISGQISVVPVVIIIISALAIYFMFTDENAKRQFGRA